MRRTLLSAVCLLSACGGGGGGAPAAVPAPVVLACSGPLEALAGGLVTVTGTGFPGAPGSPVTLRFLAPDERPFGGCGSSAVEVVGSVAGPTLLAATVPPFLLTRDVTAVVEADFGGVVARSATGIASFLGTADVALDHDLDGIPDACDPQTLTFQSDAVGAVPAGCFSWDGNPALLTVRDVGGDHAAAYAATSDAPYDRLTALRADLPQQDTDVYLDLETAPGDFNLELWSDGSYRGAAGAGLIFQVRSDGGVTLYERLWNSILTSKPGPPLPASGRVRLRVRKLPGTSSEVHLDAWNGTGWTPDTAVWPVLDDRQYRGLDVSLCNYWFGGATRGVKRITVVHAVPDAPLSIGESPATCAAFSLFQRDGAGVATIPVRVLARPTTAGRVQARMVVSETGEPLDGHDWGAHEVVVPVRPEGLRLDLSVAAVPAGGNYDVQVRLLDDATPPSVVSQQVLRDVAVGDVWVAAGQSNTSGYSGTLFGADAPIPEVHLFGNDGRWKEAVEPVDGGSDQTDVVSYENPTTSFLLAFGKETFQRTGVPVALVPASLGGTNLYAQWQRYAANPAARQTLYGSMLHRARVACPATPPRGILWFQGESDALTPRTRAQYLADLSAFVGSVRGDLAAPGLVFLCGQLGTFSDADLSTWLPVQEAQREWVASDAHAALATAVDLPRADGIHFNVAGYGTLGRRFALGARRLVFGQAVDPTDDLVAAVAGAGGTSVVLTFEAPVGGGAPALFRVADGGGAVAVTGVSVSLATVTLSLARALGASPVVSYGWSVDPAAAWLEDPSGAAVPVFDGVPVGP